MKQVFNVKGSASVRDVPEPICSAGEVLVRNMHSVISAGTELKSLTPGSSSMLKMALKRKDLVQMAIRKARKDGILSTFNFAKAMMDNWWPLGYSCVGEVMEVGRNISDIAPGDIVACCGQDIANHAEYVTVPRLMVAKVPKGTDLRQASFATIGAIVIHALHRGDISFGQTVVIYGMGLLGQIAAKICSAAGCRVIGTDISEERVSKAKQSLHHGIVSGNPVDDVLTYTNGIGADVVLVMAQADTPDIVNNAMEMCRKKGKVVVVGHVALDLKRKPFYEKELDVLISRAYGPGRHDPNYEQKGIDYPIDYVRWTINRNMEAFLMLLHDNRIDLRDMIEKEVRIEDAEDAYASLQAEGKKPLTVLISYPEGKLRPGQFRPAATEARAAKAVSPASHAGPAIHARRRPKDIYNVAVIGGGSFAREVHLPLLSRHPRFCLKAIMTKTGATAAQLAGKYAIEKTVSSYEAILSDSAIDLVVIVTPHAEHASYAIKAIEAGKNVFVEKPMALTWEECLAIADALKRHPVIFTVGHHKTFSAVAQHLAPLLHNRRNPFVMNHRTQLMMNPRKEWLYDPEVGGGRIIGELCHVYDFINWAAQSSATTLSATAIRSSDKTVLPESNLVADVAYEDGSVASVTYSEQGNPVVPKERIEIFVDGSIIVIEDGVTLTVNGKRQSFAGDRGFEKHYSNLLDALDGKKSELVSVDRALATMQLTFGTLNSIKGVREL